MKWSYKLVRIAGIDVSVHITFFLLLLWFAMVSWRQTQEWSAVLTGIAFILVLFACVVMHEFGHALTARRFGINTRGITLLPIGGVASLEKMPDDPKEEIQVALAGPAVNGVIATLLWLYFVATSSMPTVDDVSNNDIPFLFQIMVINIMLAVFNLLPAFPMDGGRVLRAVFALFMPHNDATQRAAMVGQTFAFALAVLGIMYNPWLILIAGFIWLAGSAEANMEKMQTSLHKIPVADAMITDFHQMDSHDTLQAVIDATLHGSQKDYPVIEGGRPRYVLTQSALLQALQSHSPDSRLKELELPDIVLADHDESVESIFKRLQGEQRPALVGVMQNGRLAGIVNLDNILELIRINSALQSRVKDGGLSM